MPFPMKIQPLECGEEYRVDSGKVVLRSRLKRLFDRQFQRVLKITENGNGNRDGGGAAEMEPSSVCLAKMVQNFIEESFDKQLASTKCGRNRCNCFKANINNSSDDDLDISGDQISSSTSSESIDSLKSLVPCSSVAERNLLADTSRIFEKAKPHKRKDEEMRRLVAEGLASLGYDASICKSRWEKSPSHPAGEYEYIDAIVDDERLLIDIDFRSEFQIARPTGSYKALLQSLPSIFVGKSDRLQQIVSIMSEASKQSLKQKGMPFPPWRKAEYLNSKWVAAHSRAASPLKPVDIGVDKSCGGCVEVELEFNEEIHDVAEATAAWIPPVIRVKSVDKEGKAVTGLASLLKTNP